VDRGDLVRLTRGVAVARVDWEALGYDEQRWLRVEAVLSTVRHVDVVSHVSAAAYWGLPVLASDRRVHVTDPCLARTRSGPVLVRHAAPLGPDEIVDVGGLRVTSLRRTTVDLARSRPFEDSVVLFDHLLHRARATRSQLRSALEAWPTVRGIERALSALGFADERSESPGESRSRVAFRRIGFPGPVLQQPFDTDIGTVRTDFWWPAFGVVGEFDGRVKYGLPLAGADGDVLFAEKRREDALRRQREVTGVARWTSDDLADDGRLERVLRAAGLALLGPRFVWPEDRRC